MVSEAAEFLRDIQASPSADGPRLAYADWLAQRGDPLAEFIRVQCALEPVREQDSEEARQLRQREEDLLLKDSGGLLGSLWRPVYGSDFLPVFRRGFAERVALPAPMFLEHGLALARDFPLARELVLYDLRERAEELAKSLLLGRYPHLGLFDWLTEKDANCLANSPYLREVQSLTIWLGGRQEETVCRTLAKREYSPQF